MSLCDKELAEGGSPRKEAGGSPLEMTCDLTTCFSDSGSECLTCNQEESMYLQSDTGREGLQQSPSLRIRRKRALYSSYGGFPLIAPQNSILEETVRLSSDLNLERSKVDTLQSLLLQRESQKEAFFLQSLKKEKECFALREELMALQVHFEEKTREQESRQKAHNAELEALQEKASQLEAENTSLHEFSDMLETHAEQLRQTLADLEAEKQSFLEAKQSPQPPLASCDPTPSPPCSLPDTPKASAPLFPAWEPAPTHTVSAYQRSLRPLLCSMAVLVLLALYGLGQLLKSQVVVL